MGRRAATFRPIADLKSVAFRRPLADRKRAGGRATRSPGRECIWRLRVMDSRTRLVAPVLVAAAICSWQSAHACGGVTAYSGRATVVNAQANLLKSSTKVVVADTGEIDPTGATRDATVVTFDNPAPTEVHSQTLSAVASGDNDVSAASAAVQKLVIKAHGVTIKADLIEADSEARCHEDSMTVSTAGMANLVNLTINGKGITWNHKVNDKRTLIGIG